MRKTAQQWMAMVFGLVFLLVAILGMLGEAGMSMESSPDHAFHLFGLFPVNLLHNIVHLLFGLWGILAARSIAATRTYGRAGAAIYIVLAVLGLVRDTMFWVPLGGNNIWLHAVLGLGLAVIGFTSSTPETVAT